MIKKLCISFLLLAPLLQAESSNNNTHNMWITVFIHGSFSLRPHLNISNILKMLNDAIEETVYYRSTEINRRDPFFYKNQAMGEMGLHKIDITKPTTIMAAPTVAQAFEEVAQLAGYAPSDQYYTFGWSGLVSNKLRYIEANFLYTDLAKLIKKLRNQGHNPKVRIIGYSHGGNIGLQLGALHHTKNSQDQIYIDEFHLLGTPIQVETDYLINSSVFKRVYNWYSRSDGVQSLDFFSFKRWFSRKKFTKRKNFSLPDKLTQIRIKVSNFKQRAMKKQLHRPPENNKEIKKYFKEFNYDPGHFELWFMGWTILTYRKEFPTNPLPIMIFIPLITKYLQEHPNAPRDLVAEIQPYFNKVELYPYRAKHKKHFHIIKPFVDENKLQEMRTHALKFVPDNYNIETYNRKVYDAIKTVDHELNKIRKLTKMEQKKVTKLNPIINLHKDENIYQGHFSTKK
ncbi:MAG: hypothetical protein CL947_03045 [Epsilonproteobacteria bacterium]|nr:hypothetical protein [Campylobacterota bacterium]